MAEIHYVCFALMCLLQIYRVSGRDMVDFFSSRILAGDEVFRDEYPFIVALYRSRTYECFCGGTVVSDQHILTAASCVQSKGSSQNLSPNEIVVRLGAYNLTNEREEGAVQMNVREIYVHPDWKVYDDAYDADIAILVLSEKVNFTDFIQPVALLADNIDVKDFTGTIIGWGLAEDKRRHEEIPKQADIQALNDSYCYRQDYGVVPLSSARTFCGGQGDGTPNIGDAGGGFFVYTGAAWEQYGVISASTTDDRGQIHRNSTSVYGNLKYFKNWIVDKFQINDRKYVDLNCTYRPITTNKMYACCLHDLDLRTENIYVSSITGSHRTSKTDQDVEMIYFNGGTMVSLPNGIGHTLNNLKGLQIEHCLSIRLITRPNLQNFENLVELNVYRNEIALLTFDALWDLPALEIFRIMYNKIKVLDYRTFERNRNLKRVYLQSNQLEVLPRGIFKNNFLLERVDLSKNALRNIEVDFTVFGNVQRIILDFNTCIDAYYSKERFQASYPSKKFTDLSLFQRKIRDNCSARYG